MTWTRPHRLAAIGVFGYALVLYVLTVAPTASFWDSGEFIAIASGLQVSHPPGAPFYMLIGRLFSMFVPQSVVSLSVNMVSVLCSALTILLTYWIIVRLVREFQGKAASDDPGTLAIIGGVIGACTFAVTDSFWFNAVEAEVYAMSMLFTALVVWLIMRWGDEVRAAKGKGSTAAAQENRLLVLVAYLFGLAIGAHLMSLLALFFIALVIFFIRFDRDEWTVDGGRDWASRRRWGGILATLTIAAVIFVIIYPGIIQKLPVFAGSTGAPLVAMFVLALAVIGLIVWTHRRRYAVMNLSSICLLMVLIGYSTYALIFIRSAADPPIDENDPENPAAIVSYLAREQYGETPLLRGASFDNSTGYLSRTERTFPRRHSPAEHHAREYGRYDSDLDFFLKYQVGHMYVRYFLWQFAGRESDIQDARAITGIPPLDGEYETYFQTPSERASRNKYFALPLVLGLLGMIFHFSKDWRRAFCVMVLFLVTGVGIVVYLNQTPFQPRERDYAYVASFFAFSLWVGIGAVGLIQMVRDTLGGRWRATYALGMAGILFVLVPGIMTEQNYDDHDRSGRYVAPDYAYNMLQSLDENAIVFTNGDNDTFPLWYAQEVEGVRRDVRVANLSLLNTPWYIHQLKHQYSRDSAPLPISMPDNQIDRIGLSQWIPREVVLPVDTSMDAPESEVFASQFDRSQVTGPMRWTLTGRAFGQDAEGNTIYGLYAADQAALDIIATNAQAGWTRPIYFAVTVAPSGRLDLENYFQLEGQAYRIAPIQHEEDWGRIDAFQSPEVLHRFRFRNLDNPKVYFDENIRRMTDNYRNVYSRTAIGMIDAGRSEEAVALLDTLMEAVPFETIPGEVSSFAFMSRAYEMAGHADKAVDVLQSSEPYLLYHLETERDNFQQQRLQALVQQLDRTYLGARDYEAYAAFRSKLNTVIGDPTIVTPESIQAAMEGAMEAAQADTDSVAETAGE